MSGTSPICCPSCYGELCENRCLGCATQWGTIDGFPALYREDDVTGLDRFMRRLYNGLPALHDPLTRYLLPRLQRDKSEDEMRAAYLERLRLDELPVDRPCRILEVGVGTGANIALVHERAYGAELTYFGVDLSLGMLRHGRRRAAAAPLPVELMLADAHRLPFKDNSFDRVFHVGAIGSFRDPALALAEMVRVARANTPIVVVDEELDPTRHHSIRDRLAFKLLTFYDSNPRCPVHALPPTATDIEHTAISRFYYCLSFRCPEHSSER